MSERFEHIVPQIGTAKIQLFPPSYDIYNHLLKNKEVFRLNKLRHLGALSNIALNGARLARWDYTVALLYYSEQFDIPTFKSKFNIGRVEFSSTIAALQCASLIWNIGHLPGTFSVEKGVCRNLIRRNSKEPASFLKWPFEDNREVNRIKLESSKLLIRDDYFGISRVLAVLKLLLMCKSSEDELFVFTVDFASPLLLGYEKSYSRQWSKIKKSFSMIRHLSYLTVDLPFSGHRWAPNIPDLLKHYIGNYQGDINIFYDKISELLSPIEKNIYDSMYHSDRSKEETAIYADLADRRLETIEDSPQEIINWLNSGLSKDLRLGAKPKKNRINRCIQIHLRDQFSIHPDSCTGIEFKLKNIGFSHSAVFKYVSWNSDTLFEPDELIIDVLVDRRPCLNDIGKIAYWFLSEFDSFFAKHDDTYKLLRKQAIESSYSQIFSRAVEMYFPGVTVKIEPWGLNKFGIFPKYSLAENRGGIWAANAKLDDPITGHILRDRTGKIVPELQNRYLELMGIKALKDELRKEWETSTPRCRWLILTSSIIFCRDGKNLIEYDGGLLKISSRSGKLTWYGIETKNGSENPLRSLKKRLKTINIKAKTKAINTKHAYVEIKM